MAELAVHETFWLRSMLRPTCTKAEYNALLRAAMKLEEAGLITIDRYTWGSESGIGKTAIRAIDTAKPDRKAIISVGKVPWGHLANTYSDMPKQTGAFK
jgi:hypothetical protein